MPTHVYDPRTGTALDMADATLLDLSDPMPDTRFAGLTSDDLDSMGSEQLNLFRDTLLSSLPRQTRLHRLAPTQSLTEKQLALVMSGDYSAARNDLDPDVHDAAHLEALRLIDQTLHQMQTSLDETQIPHDLQDECLDRLQSVDVSEPVQDLLEQTPPVLLLYRLYQSTTWTGDVEIDRKAARHWIRNVLDDTCIGYGPANMDAIDTLLDTIGPMDTYLNLYVVITHAPAPLASRDLVRNIMLTDPWVMLTDTTGRQVTQAQLSGQMRLRIDPAQTLLDGISRRRFVPEMDPHEDEIDQYATEITELTPSTHVNARLTRLLRDCHDQLSESTTRN